MTLNKRLAMELDTCIIAFSLISKKDPNEILSQITSTTESFDTIMFKHENTELFLELHNKQHGTLIIN